MTWPCGKLWLVELGDRRRCRVSIIYSTLFYKTGTRGGTVITIYYCIGAEVALKLVNLSPDKMRSIVVWLLLLSVLVAVVSIDVDGDSTCNKTVESLDATLLTLVATLETEFEQLKAEIKENCCPGSTNDSSLLVKFFSHYLLLLLNVCCCIFSWLAQSYSSCKEIYADNYG